MNILSPRKQAVALTASSLILLSVASPIMAEDGQDLHQSISVQTNEATVEIHQSTESSHVSIKPPAHQVQMANMSEMNDNISSREAEIKANVASKVAELKLRIQNQKDEIKARLEGDKLKACQNRQAAIVKQTSDATKFAQNLESKFGDIATKVEAFKTDKNITVSNYDALVADVAAKKTAVDAAITAAQSDQSTFSCTSDGPKAQLQDFVLKMDAVRQALKDYKTAVHNLIQGVRQANGQDRQASSSATPTTEAQ